MHIRSVVIIFFLLLQNAVASKTTFVVFPLKNGSASELHEWIGYGIAEAMTEKLHSLEGFQVWDPIFIFQTDSTGYEMDADSILGMHRARWHWDVAVGGKYWVSGDTLRAKFKVIWATGREEPLKAELSVVGWVSDFSSFVSQSLLKIFKVIRYDIASPDAAVVQSPVPYDADAYRTYTRGYGYEMRGNNNAALTAYVRAEEIDHTCGDAVCRQGILYRRSNDFIKARAAFERAFGQNKEDPDIAAEYADFLVDCDAPAVAFKFIDGHRPILSMRAAGMKAMGKMYIATGEYQRAIALLTKAVAFGPVDLEVEFALGSAHLAAGDFTRASDIFNHLIEYRPMYLRYYASLGGAYRKAGKLMESTIVLESAEKISPENTTILIELAHTYIMLGWYEKAEQLLLRSREVSPLLSDINVNLGVVYWYQGKKREALRCFDEAAAVSTTRQSAYNNMGSVQFLSGSAKKAIAAYKKADKAGRRNETVLYNLASAYLKEGNRKKAAAYFDQMLLLAPDRIDVLVRQSRTAVELKRYDDAERHYHKIIELLPDQEEAIRGLVSIYLKQKRYKEALQPIENFLERQPLNKEFMLQLASIYLTMEWYEVALMKYQTVIKEFPGDSGGYRGVGKCMYALIKYKGQQNYDNAILALKQASERAPDDPEPDMLIGDIYSEYKEYPELAADHWKKALRRARDKQTRNLLERKLAGKK